MQTGIICVARAMQCCSMLFVLCRMVPSASRCAVLVCCAVLCQVLRACITLCSVPPTVLHWAGFAMLRCYAELSNCAVFPVVLRCANFTETDKSIKPLKAAYLIRGADPLSKTLNNFLVTLTVKKSKKGSLCSTDLSTESGKLGSGGIQ